MKKVAIHTVGCKLNYTETSTIGKQFSDRGFILVDDELPADIYILNTCTVTEHASRECRQLIRRVVRNNPNAYLAVVGCYSQLNSKEIASIDGIDLILGTSEKFKIFDYVNTFTKNPYPEIYVSCINENTEFNFASASSIGGRTRAFIKIQDGCDYNCAFCTVPMARGKSRSSSVNEIVQQVIEIVNHGFKEIVLTGVNIGDYGKQQNSDLLELLKELENIDGPERIRLSSIEPNLLSYDLLDFIIESNKFCNHFHIPLQSGSDSMLKNMKRRYLSKDYKELIESIKKKDNDSGIGVDVITGFPGETDELFEETYSFLIDLPITYLHAFPYSERQNTAAVNFDGKVKHKVRYERTQKLRTLSQKKKREFYSSFIGKNIPVLFEERKKEGFDSGLTKNYIRVETISNNILTNQIRNVTIKGINRDACVGDVKEELSFS